MPFVTVPVFTDNDAADLERLNTIISNLNYLNDNKVKVSYNAYGVKRTDGVKLACGTTDAVSTGPFRNRWISSGNFFTPGTRPVAVVSYASLRNRTPTLSIAQRTGESPILDHTGLSCYVRTRADTNALSGPGYINWIMMGY